MSTSTGCEWQWRSLQSASAGCRTDRYSAWHWCQPPRSGASGVLSGLLSNIGRRDERRPQRDRRTRVEYRGARGARFEVVPGSAIGRANGEWVVAAEVVETDLRARRVSAIQPEWIEPMRATRSLARTGTVERHIWSSGDSGASRSTGLQSSRTSIALSAVDKVAARHVYREGAHCWDVDQR